MQARTSPNGLGICCTPKCSHRFPLLPFISSPAKSYFSQFKQDRSFFSRLSLLVANCSIPYDHNELASIHEHSDGSFTFSFGQPVDTVNAYVEHHSEASSEIVSSVIITENADVIDYATAYNESPSNTDYSKKNKFFLESGISSLTHPLEAFSNGEDAVLTTPTWLGVADGTKQWSFKGDCSGHFARDLMKHCEKLVADNTVSDPKEVLSAAAALAEASGLSTCLIGHVNNDILHVANVGNSGFLVVRKGEILECFLPTLEFNFPVFFSRSDNPIDLAKEYDVVLEEGDVVVCGTVGLFDNMYKEEVAAIVNYSRNANWSPQEMAEKIAENASALGRKSSGRSPFADAAEAAGYSYSGGKVCDLTVIVSFVQVLDRFSFQ